jgi:hypothetical protein
MEKAQLSFLNGLSRPKRIVALVLTILVLFFFIVGIVSGIGFIKEKIGDMDTPQEAGQTLLKTVKSNDYDKYQSLLAQDSFVREDRELFDKLRDAVMKNEDAMVSNFVLIRLENGRQYLCSLFYDSAKKEFSFRTINEVPAVMQDLFVS